MDSPSNITDEIDQSLAAGLALHKSGQFAQAEAVYRDVLARRPNHSQAMNLLAKLASDLGHEDVSLQLLERAVSLAPHDPNTHHNLGLTYFNRGRLDAAVDAFRRAVTVKPDFFESWKAMAVTGVAANRLEDALAGAERCCSLRPGDPALLTNLAIVLAMLERDAEAVAICDRAIEIQPDFVDAHWQRGLALLATGDFGRGWLEFEWRQRTSAHTSERRDFIEPLWQGDDIDGQTLLLHAEQGFGDTIQFVRFVTRLTARAKVIVEVQPELVRLVRHSMPKVRVIARGDKLPPFDLHAPIMSLPAILGATASSIRTRKAYLKSNRMRPKEIKKRLAIDFNVGIAWSGRPGHRDDRFRSIPREEIDWLLGCEGVTFFSLQKLSTDKPAADNEDGDADLKLSPPPSRDFDGRLNVELIDRATDFADTAGIIKHLNLVISADTAVAHLAAAMGKPTWLLLPTPGEWRWMRGRDDSPWYPSMRIFRQPARGDWRGVMEQVAAELSKLMDA